MKEMKGEIQMYVVIKRDGRQVQFDASKIEIAILKAMRYGSGIVNEELAKKIAEVKNLTTTKVASTATTAAMTQNTATIPGSTEKIVIYYYLLVYCKGHYLIISLTYDTRKNESTNTIVIGISTIKEL